MALGAAFSLGIFVGGARVSGSQSSAMDLARVSPQGGKVELEYTASGAVAVSTRNVRIENVPAVCVTAAKRAAPDGEVTGTRVQTIGGVPYFEVDVVRNGLANEILTTPDGDVVGQEEQVRIEDAPAAVLGCAHAAVPSGAVISVERVWGPQAIAEPEFHVKKDVGGEIVRVRVTRGVAVEVLRIVPASIKVAIANVR